MWLSIGYTIPQQGDRNLKVGPTPPPPATCVIELESGLGFIELESGLGFIERETCSTFNLIAQNNDNLIAQNNDQLIQQ